MYYRIPLASPEIEKDDIKKVTDAVKSGWVSSKGSFIGEFERRLSNYIGMTHGVAVSSGTAALHLALSAIGIGKKDKVIVPSLSFIAPANAVVYTGAQPVFVDSHPKYWCIDPSKISDKIDRQTRAIIAVNLYGHPCEMNEIMEIAEHYNLQVIEDCAEAHGAEYKGKKIGSFGTVSCFSFYANKIITTGEGGICHTNDEELMNKMRILRDHGMNPKKKYWHDVIGFNYRMTNLQAALGVAQINKIEYLIDKKRRIAAKYEQLLGDLKNITLAPQMSWGKSVYWLYSILIKKGNRDKVITHLEKEGIETRPFFYPIHLLPPYKDKRHVRLGVAEKLSTMGLNLPSGYQLSDDQIGEVTDLLRSNVE